MTSLYFICPTDFLESVINKSFQDEKYYYSTLGNSINFDNKVLKNTKKLIETKNIRAIYFVLSSDNRIVFDALGNQDYSRIKGLNVFYDQVIKQKETVELSWQAWNSDFLILSYYLNHKISELKQGMGDRMNDQLIIKGKIYNKEEKAFIDIYPDLMCLEYASLN